MKKIPSYIEIYQQISDSIIHGFYTYGMKIPSKRQTALENNCSVITVEHAYELLIDEGYIEAKQRSGYFVCYKVGDLFETKIEEKEISITNNGEEVFPASVFAKASRKVLSMMNNQLPSRSEGKGNLYFREAISKYLARSRGLIVDPKQIIIGAGSEYLYSLVVDLLGRSKIYGIESPSYEKIRAIYRASGVKVDQLKLGKNGILSSELERTLASVLHVTPYHSFPTGSTTDASKRREYIQWANEHHAYIVEDDYESEFTQSLKPQETLFSLNSKKVIYLNTFTKTISSSVRIGYMILPRDLLKVYEQTQSFRSCTVSEFMQLIVCELLNNGSFERNLNRIRRKRSYAKD